MKLEDIPLRERQVVILTIKGLPTKVTAAQLGITEKTVKVHRMQARDRLGLKNGENFIQWAEKNGYVTFNMVMPANPEVCSEHGWVGDAAYFRDRHHLHDRNHPRGRRVP